MLHRVVISLLAVLACVVCGRRLHALNSRNVRDPMGILLAADRVGSQTSSMTALMSLLLGSEPLSAWHFIAPGRRQFSPSPVAHHDAADHVGDQHHSRSRHAGVALREDDDDDEDEKKVDVVIRRPGGKPNATDGNSRKSSSKRSRRSSSSSDFMMPPGGFVVSDSDLPKDLGDFLKGLTGGNAGEVMIGGPEMFEDDDDDDDDMNPFGPPRERRKESGGADSLRSISSFDLKPKEIVEYLDRFVIQQDDAKKVLAVAICDHYNHCRRDINASKRSLNYAKPNILLAGPTGVGKTYLLKTIARLIGVPFVKGDATKFSETGIVGRDAEDLVRDLVEAAGGNVTAAQYGIIYIDEVDKIAAPGGGEGGGFGSTAITANTRGVQNNFLKLLEDTDVSVERDNPMSMMMGGGRGAARTISTRNILFIFSGAFTGLDAQMKSKKEFKSIGFQFDEEKAPAAEDAKEEESGTPKKRSYLRFAETADFISAGLEAEFVGRVPVRVALNALDADDLREVLTKAEGSVLQQFVRDMKGYNITMTASEDALTQVARLAAEEATGARGLVTVLERSLRQHKFELPSTGIRSFELDNATVVSPEDGLAKLLDSQTEEDGQNVRRDDLERWVRRLSLQMKPAEVAMTDEAIDYLLDLSAKGDSGGSTYWFASRHFESLKDIVKRIADRFVGATMTNFTITADVASAFAVKEDLPEKEEAVGEALVFAYPDNPDNATTIDLNASSSKLGRIPAGSF